MKQIRHAKLSLKAVRARELHKHVLADWYFRSMRENILQRYWHTRRFRELGKVINQLTGNSLDIGCSDGTFTKYIIDHSRLTSVIGVDVLDNAINFAQKKYAKNDKMSFSVAEAHKLPFKTATFDNVFCLETIEHVENPPQVIREIKRVLCKKGQVFVLIPLENIQFRIIWFFWTKWRGKVWHGTHIQEFTKDQLVDMIKKEGMKIRYNRTFLCGMLQIIQFEK